MLYSFIKHPFDPERDASWPASADSLFMVYFQMGSLMDQDDLYIPDRRWSHFTPSQLQLVDLLFGDGSELRKAGNDAGTCTSAQVTVRR